MLITLEQQIAAMRRELAMRRNVYKRRVMEGRMTVTEAVKEFGNALAIIKSLEHTKDGHLAVESWYFDPQDLERQLFA